MASSLSNLVDNLAEGIHKIKCKDWDCFLEYENVKDNLIKYVYLAIKIIQTSLMKNWMIEKSLMKQPLPKKEFYTNLNIKEITDADYMHGKWVCKDFEIKKLGKYYDLYLKSDRLLLADAFNNFKKMCLKLLLADAFNNFKKMCLKIYQLDPFSSWISMTSIFNKDRSKIRIINWHWYIINGWKRN